MTQIQSQHQMNTRSKKRRNYDIDEMNINLSASTMKESEYNLYAGQNICNIRNVNLKDYLIDALNDPLNNNNEEFIYQEIYDIGCALIALNVVKKKIRNSVVNFELNENFADYDSWKNYEDVILENCDFLQKIRHPAF